MQFIEHIKRNIPGEIKTKLQPYLKKAEDLSSTNEQEAYVLATLIKRAVKKGELLKSLETQVHGVARRSPQYSYYEHEQKPEFDDWTILPFCFTVMGLFAVIAGIYMLMENRYFITFHIVYLVQTIKGGGYMVILGLVFLWGGMAKLKQQYNLRQLYK